MNLIGTYRATQDVTFRSRVIAATVISALDIINDPAYVNTTRAEAAWQILNSPAGNGWTERFVWLTASNAAIAASVQEDGSVAATDSDIHYVVSGVWSMLFPDDGSLGDYDE